MRNNIMNHLKNIKKNSRNIYLFISRKTSLENESMPDDVGNNSIQTLIFHGLQQDWMESVRSAILNKKVIFIIKFILEYGDRD